MAYLIGLITDEEKQELIKREFKLEKCPEELIPTDPEFAEDKDNYVMIYLDCNLVEVLDNLDAYDQMVK